ncbi:TonB-dependent receptor [Sphingomonas sp. So64.6b]|uniref:TonB-dependent receptor n=1 Tax=Sphingomonas sp. So64.6b TaxID=2997354 RepID=UPI0015FF2588|nr:TonB-dependent receptor [Sphingomonas sp. So64.6b]QNA84488.1 TonB-dependent receptor [Sphingomonas sp. So64.6b]
MRAVTTISAGVARRLEIRALRTGTSVAALAIIALSAPAFAQEQAAANQSADQNINPAGVGDTEGDIVVTGIRASLEGARDRKRNAEQLVDSITAQDIGALPDRSVSEALQRIPGITLQRTNENRDPARLSAEGGGVFIRGLSFVRSELNGRDVFSANNGRGLSFEDVSADLLGGVDVYKNPSADLVEGGIGGIVNLRTRKPFDTSGYLFAFSGDSTYGDLLNKSFQSGNILGSGRWKTPIGEIGVLLSYSIGNVGNRTDSISAGRYDRAELDNAQDGLPVGANVYVPAGMGFRRIDWKQRRTAFDGSIQWKPSDTLLITGEALISKATPQDIEYAVGDYDTPNPNLRDNNGQLVNTGLRYNDDHVLEAGTLNNRNLNFDTRSGKQVKKTRDYSLNLRWTPDDHWSFGADVQYVKSTAQVYSMTAFTQVGTPSTINFDFSSGNPSLTISPTAANGSLTNRSLYWWAAAMDHIEDNEAHEWAERADVEYTFTDSDFLKSFRVGGRATDRNAITRQTGYNWSLLSAQYWGGGPQIYLDQTGLTGPNGLPVPGAPQNPGLPNQTTFQPYNNFFRGNVPSIGPGFWFPSASLVSNGTANAYSYLRATEAAGWGWAPLSGDYSLAAPGGDNVSGGINNQSEKTYAGYALLRFGQQAGMLGHFDGNIGVRVIKTETGATGSALRVGNITNPTCVVSPGGATQADCNLLAQAIAFTQGNIGALTQDSSGSYTDTLPSLNLRFFLKDNLQLRFAAAKAIVRPTFAQLNPFTSLSFSFDANGIANGVGVNGRRTAFTGTAGNPDLKPTRSDQFDTSLEYYFGRSNSLTFAAFYKRISNYIFAGTTQQTYTSNGQTVTFDVTQQTNGSRGTIKGFEVGYTQFFDGLPGALSGLGFQGNFTFVDSTGGKNTAINVFDANQTNQAAKALPLEGLSKYSFNVTGIYEKYGISARLAYNWRSTYLLTTSAANINFPVWSESYGQLDGSILYAVDKHFKIGVQGTNLLNSRTFLDVGDPDLKPRYSWTDSDRRFSILVRGVF